MQLICYKVAANMSFLSDTAYTFEESAESGGPEGGPCNRDAQVPQAVINAA